MQEESFYSPLVIFNLSSIAMNQFPITVTGGGARGGGPAVIRCSFPVKPAVPDEMKDMLLGIPVVHHERMRMMQHDKIAHLL